MRSIHTSWQHVAYVLYLVALGHKSVRELVGVTMDGFPIPGDSCTFPLLIEDDEDDAASPVKPVTRRQESYKCVANILYVY